VQVGARSVTPISAPGGGRAATKSPRAPEKRRRPVAPSEIRLLVQDAALQDELVSRAEGGVGRVLDELQELAIAHEPLLVQGAILGEARTSMPSFIICSSLGVATQASSSCIPCTKCA
jgi:hypothetical protein